MLIAEDNLLNRRLLRDQLCTLGTNVIEAKDGEEALALLERERVDIVLTEIDMPVMNGNELLEAARVKYPSLAIYAVSANARPEDIAQGRRQGFADYLSKPVPLAALVHVLDAAASPDPIPREAPAPELEIPRFPSLPPSYGGTFVEQANRDLAALADIVSARDLTRLERWAHGVSGGLSVLGPSMLYEASQELRTTIAAASAWDENVAELLAAIADELKTMRGDLLRHGSV